VFSKNFQECRVFCGDRELVFAGGASRWVPPKTRSSCEAKQ
jgi:hypothetical protein